MSSASFISASSGPSEALKLAEEIIERLGEPLTIDGETLTPSVSVGVTFARSSNDRPAELLREAQTAARRARELGGRRGEVYDPELQRLATTRLRREAKLREAIRERRIDAVMQPILRLSDEKIVGFEALARLAEPDGGLVPPDTFVPIAEELGLISTISERVLRRALSAVRALARSARPRPAHRLGEHLRPRGQLPRRAAPGSCAP
jgi:predicted signal transduction protein with EAL and GGDEF domain